MARKAKRQATCLDRARVPVAATTRSRLALTLRVLGLVRAATTRSSQQGLMADPAVLPPVLPVHPLALRVPVDVQADPVAPVVLEVHVPLLVAVPVVPVAVAVPVVSVAAPAAPVAPVALLVAVPQQVAVVAVEAPLVRSVAPEVSLHVHVSPSVPSGWNTRSSKLLPSAASRSLGAMAKR
jgi:hypothetical protein